MIEETKKPLVSVIIPCYKTGRFIGEALESVGKQSYLNWEVLAVDDCGPEDGTREAVKAFAANHPDQRVEYIRHDCNRGVSAARNTGIRAARGSVVARPIRRGSPLRTELLREIFSIQGIGAPLRLPHPPSGGDGRPRPCG